LHEIPVYLRDGALVPVVAPSERHLHVENS
jgi:hypothetical protein